MAAPAQLMAWWNSISQRERSLVRLLAIAVPGILALWLGRSLLDGLDALEKRNAEMRRALVTVADLKRRGPIAGAEALETMPYAPEPLESYIGAAATTAGVSISNYGARAQVTKDGFVTTTVRTELTNTTIGQLKDLMVALETKSKYVAVTSLAITRKIREEDKEKLDIRIEVSTYSKEPVAGTAAPAGEDNSP